MVIGTHGKLKAWAGKRILLLDSINILVFDEADEMLKADGFADDSLRLIKQIRKLNPEVRAWRGVGWGGQDSNLGVRRGRGGYAS